MSNRTAIVIGASSGIGEALARQLGRAGWRLGICARREDKLETIAGEIGPGTLVRRMDLADSDGAVKVLEEMIESLGGVDLVIVSSSVGHLNRELDWAPDKETLTVNVVGYAAVAQASVRYFFKRGQGHLVGITSVASIHAGGISAAYCASKSFESTYLNGLRRYVKRYRNTITVTEAQPGFVDTDMNKSPKAFWVASADSAAEQILDAVRRKAKHAYITRRWGLVAFALKLLPRPG